jgi:hypothetical protein
MWKKNNTVRAMLTGPSCFTVCSNLIASFTAIPHSLSRETKILLPYIHQNYFEVKMFAVVSDNGWIRA